MTQHVDLLSSIGLCVSVAALLAFLANRFRQPLLLAYLLAGVLIGPQIGLGLISEEESIRTVSEVGLILLLFIIGLEMDLKKLLAAGKPVLVVGLLQTPLCVALGLAFFFPFGFAAGRGFGLVYLAVCLAISSTMIVVKLLYDKFELDTLPGRITLGVLVFQDVWAIVFLAIQPNLLQPEIGALLESLIKGVVLVAVSLVVSKTLLPRLFQSVAKVPELVLVGSLAWCFVVSGAANAAGISREMGALIAGGSISTFPYNMDVVAKVVSVRDFFVTLFFVALGMQIPMPTVDVIGVAVAASAFLVLSRFIVVFPLLRWLRLGHRASLLPSINLAQMSEFSMVIAAIGLAAHHIEQSGMRLDLRLRFHLGGLDVPDRVQPSGAAAAGGLAAAGGPRGPGRRRGGRARLANACGQGCRAAGFLCRGQRAGARIRVGPEGWPAHHARPAARHRLQSGGSRRS
jgi:Kef-type K+ transport system membrane component KefB